MERVEFSLGHSKFLAILFLIIYLGTVSIVSNLAIPFYFKLIANMLITRHFIQVWKLHVSRVAHKAIITIWQDAKGAWGCQARNNYCAKGNLQGDSFKSAWILILRLKLKTRVQPIVVPVDSLNEFQYRTLCARLNQSF